MIKRNQLPNLESSIDWRQGYWLGISVGGLIGACSGILIGLALGAL